MKRAITFVLAIAMVLSMVACTGKNENNNSTNEQVDNAVQIVDGVAQIEKLTGTPIQGSLPQKLETIADFDASEYYWADNYWNNILASGDKAFFVYHLLDETGIPVSENGEESAWWNRKKQALYYTDGETFYLLKEDVYALCGIDDTGLYLLVKDETVKQYNVHLKNKQTSLVHFNPVTGVCETVVHGAQSALMGFKEIYYSVAVDNTYIESTAENFSNDYIMQAGIYSTETKETNIVFEDDMYKKYPISASYMNGEIPTYDNAFEISFQEVGNKGTVYIFLRYPYENDIGYLRVIELDSESGEIILDSLEVELETFPQLVQEQWVGVMPTNLFYKNEAEEIAGVFHSFNGKELNFASSYLLDKEAYSARVMEYSMLTHSKEYVFFQYNIWTDITTYEMETYIDVFDWELLEDGTNIVHPLLTITLEGIEGPHLEDYMVTRAGNYMFIQTLSPAYMVLVNMNTNEIMVLGTAETQVLLPN